MMDMIPQEYDEDPNAIARLIYVCKVDFVGGEGMIQDIYNALYMPSPNAMHIIQHTSFNLANRL